MGSGTLRDTASLAGSSRQKIVGLLKVCNNLLVAVFLRSTCKVSLDLSVSRLQFEGHTTEEFHKLKVAVGTEEVTFAQTGIVIGTALIVVEGDILDNNVRLLNQSIIGVPNGSDIAFSRIQG